MMFFAKITKKTDDAQSLYQQLIKSPNLNTRIGFPKSVKSFSFRIKLNAEYSLSICCPIDRDYIFCETALILNEDEQITYNDNLGYCDTLSWNSIDELVDHINKIMRTI